MHYDLPNNDENSDLWLVREDEASKADGGYRNLKVYHLAHELGVEAHHLSLSLPKYELYETGSQLRRAAKSVSANIVEGHGRRHYKADYLRFLIYAKASLDETQEHLQYLCDCHADQTQAAALLQKADLLGRRLSRFLELVRTNHRV